MIMIMNQIPGPLYFVQGSKNQQHYLKGSNDGLLPFKQRMEASRVEANGDSTIFMQGNATCKSAKSVSRNIAALPWP